MFRFIYLEDNICIFFNINLEKVSEEVRRDFKFILSFVIISIV